MEKKIKELLNVLTLSEEEQEGWVERYAYAHKKDSKVLFEYYQSNKEYNNSYGDIGLPLSLADLAFRLRDNFHDPIGSVVWDKACWEVWAHEQESQGSNILEREHLSLETKQGYCNSWVNFWAKPIHWVVISLIARELLNNSNAEWEIEERKRKSAEKIDYTMNSVDYLRSIEWSMGCGGDKNEGQCPECYGVSKEWAAPANESWVKQFGHKRVEIGHTLECRLGNALKKSIPMYAIGQDDGKGGYGMWDGPNPSEQDMLDVNGRDENSVIIRFNPDGTDEVMYRWIAGEWMRVIRE